MLNLSNMEGINLSGYQMHEIDEMLEQSKRNGTLEKINECNHQSVVREYYLGAHSDYVCLNCGMKSLNRSDFK